MIHLDQPALSPDVHMWVEKTDTLWAGVGRRVEITGLDVHDRLQDRYPIATEGIFEFL